MTITNKPHYIPCFWSACWNKDYLKLLEANSIDDLRKTSVRKQKIFCLTLKGDKVFSTTTEKVFTEQNGGLIVIPEQEGLDYLRKSPEKYETAKQYYQQNESKEYIFSMEILYTKYEEIMRNSLKKVITNNYIENEADKLHIAFFILFQAIRNPNHLIPLLEKHVNSGKPKFDFFLTLFNQLGDIDTLIKNTNILTYSKWTLYKLDKHTFPLSDNPLCRKGKILLFPLSPKLLIEIDNSNRSNKLNCYDKTSINFSKYYDFEKLMLRNTNKEIIFSDEEKLNQLKKSSIYIDQINFLKGN